MSGLIGSLLSNARALSVHTKAVEISGRNMANVNNPDYARQRVVQASGTQELGITVIGVEHIRDVILDGQVIRESMTRSALEALSDGGLRVQTALGERVDRTSDSGILDGSGNENASTGLSKTLDDFFNAFHNLSSSPSDLGNRRVLFQKAEVLVSQFQTIDNRLTSLDTDLSDSVVVDVNRAQVLLENIAQLNKAITRLEVVDSGSAIDLRDTRQAALEDLAERMSFSTIANANGSITITARDAVSNEVDLVNGSEVPATLGFDGTNVTFGATALNVTGGSIQGTLETRDITLGRLRNDIDAMASQMVKAVNQAYNPTAATGNFFDPAGLTAGTIALEAGLAPTTLKSTDSGIAGANEIALAVAGLSNANFSVFGGDDIDGTFINFLAGVAAQVGEDVLGASERMDNQRIVENTIRNQRDSISGVSMDEEVTELVRFQRAFQATARVINVIDELLNTVVNGLVR